jgi:hypothetical protein
MAGLGAGRGWQLLEKGDRGNENENGGSFGWDECGPDGGNRRGRGSGRC